MGRSAGRFRTRSEGKGGRRAAASIVLPLAAWILVAACASAPQPESVPSPEVEAGQRGGAGAGSHAHDPTVSSPSAEALRFSGATSALKAGRFQEGYWELQSLAGQCGSGEWGRRAVLLLAAHLLDPRNPARSPEAAARLAARSLQVPTLSVSAEALARSLYVHALELGAEPVADPFGPIPVLPPDSGEAGRADREAAARKEAVGSWQVALRFRNCDAHRDPMLVRSLPEPPESTLYQGLEAAYRERAALTTRADSLQSELERVRGLLRSGPAWPDTVSDMP